MREDDNPPILRTAIKAYPTTQALLNGTVASPNLRFEFVEVEPIHRAFAPMAQRQVYDVSEMAVFTFLQAYAFCKPLVLLPVVLAARHQHGCIVHNKKVHASLRPADLPGKKVGVRAYTQTTGAWVRNILMREHGLELTSVDWITTEGAHLLEYVEPAFVRRAPEGSNLLEMLMSGTVDAAILGNDLPDDPRIAPVIQNAAEAGPAWHKATGLVPINHMLVVTRELAERRPHLVRDVYDLFGRSKAAQPARGPDLRPIGVEAITPSLELVIELAAEQQIIPRRFSVAEIFAPWRAIEASPS
jgi:4,5-dihydroxyphthalate decarboxylase